MIILFIIGSSSPGIKLSKWPGEGGERSRVFREAVKEPAGPRSGLSVPRGLDDLCHVTLTFAE